eukprot:scaffold5585_cov57-Attheya_sp.AAC.9
MLRRLVALFVCSTFLNSVLKYEMCALNCPAWHLQYSLAVPVLACVLVGDECFPGSQFEVGVDRKTRLWMSCTSCCKDCGSSGKKIHPCHTSPWFCGVESKDEVADVIAHLGMAEKIRAQAAVITMVAADARRAQDQAQK